jgi:hypothetical protein
VLAVCLAAVVVLGTWYVTEGRDTVEALLARRLTGTDLPVDDLPVLHFEIEPQAYDRMYQQWHASLRDGIPQIDERDWVQARVRFQGGSFPVSLWLKEETLEHWRESKWSLRVVLPEGSTVLGMSSFLAQSPAVRRYLDEWLYVQSLRSAGILAPRYEYAHIWVNGEDWGVYALQEGMSEAFLASQERSGGVVVGVDDSLYGRQRARLAHPPQVSEDLARPPSQWPGLPYVDVPHRTGMGVEPAVREQSTAALGLLRGFQSGQLTPSQVFDTSSVGRYIAHSHLWGARYGPWFGDERYYYHPPTSRLEPIGGDAWPLEHAYEHSPTLAQYDDPAIAQSYVEEALRISQPEYLDRFQATYEDEYARYRAALSQEFPAAEVSPPWNMLGQRQELLFRSLHPQRTVDAYCKATETGAAVQLRVANLLTYPVVLDAVQAGDRSVEVQYEWVVPEHRALMHQAEAPGAVLRQMVEPVPRYVALDLPQSDIEGLALPDESLCSGALRLVTHIAGMSEPVVIDVAYEVPAEPPEASRPPPPTVEQALTRHPFLSSSERPGFLELRPGDWEVDGDLVLPDGYGVLASQPVTLRFDPRAIFLANGPLLLHGSAEGAISLLPKDDHWAGIVVLDAGDEIGSSLAYVTVRGTTGILREGWHVPGGVTFYDSPVVLSHCRFTDVLAQSALHIARTRFECVGTGFEFLSADGLRGDYVAGGVEGCTFHDVLGNALDLSGSYVSVRDLDLSHVYGRGISAGGRSVVSVKGVQVGDAAVALSSHGMSHVDAVDVDVRRIGTAGLAAYAGDTGYGPASIRASGVAFHDDDVIEALAERGSSVTLEGNPVESGEIDLSSLYWRESVVAPIRATRYRLGPDIWLVGYGLAERELAGRRPLELTLYWRAETAPDRDYTVFVHVLDASGQTIAGWDAMPRENAFPTTTWPVRRTVDDPHTVPLPGDMPPGEYRVVVGMYYHPSGERLPVSGPRGESVPDAAIVLAPALRVE